MAAGRLYTLLGPNGVGKSTLLRVLAGLQAAQQGTITLNGQRSPLPAPTLARQLAIVLSEYPGSMGLRVEDLVRLARAPYNGWQGRLSAADREQVARALAATGMEDFRQRPLGSLSDGERQRAMIARAVAQDTPLILLDEPTSHLDLPNRAQMLRLLHRLSRDLDKAILLSTHDLDLALQAADRLWLLGQRGYWAEGSPETLVQGEALSRLFGDGEESFDWQHGGVQLFRPQGVAVRLEGAAEWQFWQRRALARHDVQVRAEAHWQVRQAPNGALELLDGAQPRGQYEDTEALARALRGKE